MVHTRNIAVDFQHVGKVFQGSKGTFRALEEVCFTIGQGEFFGLLGPDRKSVV